MKERRRNIEIESIENKNMKREKMKMKNVLKASMTGLLALALTACSSSTASTTTSTDSASTSGGKYDYLVDTTDLVKAEIDTSNADGVLKSVLEKGVLTIATSPDYPPAEWIDDKGTIYGSEMMLAKYVADSLGVELAIETMDFTSTFAAVDTGKADIAFSGYGWKADRAEQYELSIGYQSEDDDDASKHTLITVASQEGQYNSLEDFVGKKIVAQATSLQEMYVTDEILSLDTDGTTQLEQVATLDQAILSLASGKCDAVALDESTAENYVAQSEGQFVLTNVFFDLTPYGDFQGNVALAKKGETSLIEAVNTAIECAKENGYYGDFYQEAKAAAGIEE